MAINKNYLRHKLFRIGPILLIYFLSISEIDTAFSNLYAILSFNLQIIIIYYWMLQDQNILSNAHIFFVGIINDVVMGLPLGVSSLSYLSVSFVASYIKQVTVNITLFTDWFTFLIAIFFSNLIYLVLINNFSDLEITYTTLFYNSFFTFLFYPIFWVIFNLYRSIMIGSHND
tara:strand:- start:440 stop:958 length:519 start_codon:yes stop_codon:yes gene_type:complete